MSWAATGGFADGFIVGLATDLAGAAAAGGGAYFAVLRYKGISYKTFTQAERKDRRYLDVGVLDRSIETPSF